MKVKALSRNEVGAWGLVSMSTLRRLIWSHWKDIYAHPFSKIMWDAIVTKWTEQFITTTPMPTTSRESANTRVPSTQSNWFVAHFRVAHDHGFLSFVLMYLRIVLLSCPCSILCISCERQAWWVQIEYHHQSPIRSKTSYIIGAPLREALCVPTGRPHRHRKLPRETPQPCWPFDVWLG